MKTNEEYLDGIKRGIKTHGHIVQVIGGGSTSNGWMHTIGLTERGLPELPCDRYIPGMDTVFNNLAKIGIQEGEIPVRIYNDLGIFMRGGANVRFLVRSVTSHHDDLTSYIALISAIYPNQKDILQVMWSDSNNILPNEDGYNHEEFEQHLF